MKQLAILSGKGGTGKTTVAATLSTIVKNKIMADCDVEAPNLNIVLQGEIIEKQDFYGKETAVIDKDKCIECGLCEELCRFGAISNFEVNPYYCEGCGLCMYKCPVEAIKLVEEKTGHVIYAKTKSGEKVVYAELFPGADGSGKLVTEVRKKAKEVSDESDEYLIIDGTPGIGCPVLASATGVDLVLIVTEPTLSGFADMKRVLSAIESFKVPSVVCVNKWDLNKEVSQQIEKYCEENKIVVVGKIDFDETVVKALKNLQSLSSYPDSTAYQQIYKMWLRIKEILDEGVESK
ncbi:Cobyrinic acid ac-diamide synthase [Thermoanaerobacter mathranii subsp. mathranii str. A3]|uniref:Cobyrinic acid ac-diamide synthase n=3 Tax=Thermoanaerobacter TaxID=1754 RepID=D3T3X6_THEIA|nr:MULTISPECIES: ATP-binding protein [Thermoanaerobacter]ADD02928.1 Cobyrinic acid ac-diamide synthase [Thermoanaerobacter italicus Ab9]ADH61369.1 Cobyrinic acid ac-diamide synthase [Thermoanaerobacter mathranii subsp. mathranii str. A3]MDP9750450.1 MinD superfamily P-loop ATPase [Thermoanaerobacter pentosaceus]